MTLEEYILLHQEGTTQKRFFDLLSDQRPHCRKCAQTLVGSEQLAGVVEFKAFNAEQNRVQEL